MKTILTLSLMFLAAISSTSLAQQVISYQGVVTGASLPFQDSVKVAIYDPLDSAIYKETHYNVQFDKNGLFNILIGSLDTIPMLFKAGNYSGSIPADNYYLGITIGTGTEDTPRSKFGSSPTAWSSRFADSARGSVTAGTSHYADTARAAGTSHYGDSALVSYYADSARVIGSGAATNGQVLTANGSGGSMWGTPTFSLTLPYSQTASSASALFQIVNDGTGNAIVGEAFGTSSGAGGYFEAGGSGSGDAVFAYAAGSGFGVHAVSTNNALEAEYDGTGTSTTTTNNIAIFTNGGTNKARIDNTGKGYFDGGTQNGGADIAEAFAVEGDRQNYEPGDVLVISSNSDRTVEKSRMAYSTKVIGVCATKPGVVLTERGVDENLDDLVQVGVIGVIPTKVCDEGGPIRRGDILVAASTPGFAMKCCKKIPKAGSVIGKALENFNSQKAGKIRVLVNVK